VAGAGLGSMGGYEFAQRHAAGNAAAASAADTKADAKADSKGDPRVVEAETVTRPETPSITVFPISTAEVGAISRVSREPNSNLVEVTYNQVEPRRVKGTLENPQIRQLLMMASQNAASAGVRDDSVGLLAAACRSGKGCVGSGPQSADFRDALMVSLRYDRSATVRLKALEGLQPFVGEDRQVRDALLEALENDPDARIRSAAITMLEPVEADTSVRQVLSTVALSDQNSNIRTASRVVLRRVSTIQ